MNTATNNSDNARIIPMLFVGHGSPMNEIEVNEKMKSYILSGNHKPLIEYKYQGRVFEMAVPTPEHYLPLLYILALKEENEKINFFNDKPVMGSLTMTSIKIG